jgi:hypothetical protein
MCSGPVWPSRSPQTVPPSLNHLSSFFTSFLLVLWCFSFFLSTPIVIPLSNSWHHLQNSYKEYRCMMWPEDKAWSSLSGLSALPASREHHSA